MANPSTQNKGHVKVAAICGGIALSMLALAFAAVPLYDLFCRVTGYGGTTQRAEAPAGEVLDRIMEVRFDANGAGGLNWRFKPDQTVIKVKVGQSMLTHDTARNEGDEPVVATATFNVSPPAAGAYFNKIECFCFTEQKLEPGETIDMPVVFFIDPEVVNEADMTGVPSITLSYTFFPVREDEQASEPVASLSGTKAAKPL